MNCLEIMLKYGMCIINGGFVVLGVILIIVGAVFMSTTGEYQEYLKESDGFLSIPVLLIIIGVLVTVLFFFGCCGLKRKSYWMTITFSVLLTIIFLLELIGGISAYMLQSKTEKALNFAIETSFNQTANSTSNSNQVWEDIEKKLQCCGLTGPGDYKEFNGAVPIPKSCCNTNLAPLVNGTVTCDTAKQENLWKNGCEVLIKKAIYDAADVLAHWYLIVAAFHLVWIFGACYFARAFRREDYETV